MRESQLLKAMPWLGTSYLLERHGKGEPRIVVFGAYHNYEEEESGPWEDVIEKVKPTHVVHFNPFNHNLRFLAETRQPFHIVPAFALSEEKLESLEKKVFRNYDPRDKSTQNRDRGIRLRVIRNELLRRSLQKGIGKQLAQLHRTSRGNIMAVVIADELGLNLKIFARQLGKPFYLVRPIEAPSKPRAP